MLVMGIKWTGAINDQFIHKMTLIDICTLQVGTNNGGFSRWGLSRGRKGSVWGSFSVFSIDKVDLFQEQFWKNSQLSGTNGVLVYVAVRMQACGERGCAEQVSHLESSEIGFWFFSKSSGFWWGSCPVFKTTVKKQGCWYPSHVLVWHLAWPFKQL